MIKTLMSINSKENRMKSAGFTLLELLIVIAIVGVLSSVIMSSVNGARLKAQDVLIKQELSNFASEAAVANTNAGNFDAICNSGEKSEQLFVSAWNASTRQPGEAICNSSSQAFIRTNGSGVLEYVPSGTGVLAPDKWAVSMRLYNGNYYCVDYSGKRSEQADIGITEGSDRDC